MKAKQQLKDNLCGGSVFILDGRRHNVFHNDINDCKSKEELMTLIYKYLANFSDTFSYELTSLKKKSQERLET